MIVYEGNNWHDILNRMATDNLAKQLSCSWYSPNAGADPVADQIFQQMAVQGQSFFSASGDYGAYSGLIGFPDDSPYITLVGGTTLTTSGPHGAWVSETVWNWYNGDASGGGISTQYPIPSWQQGINMTANGGAWTMRNTPDVALTADNVYVRADATDKDVGGTSCAAPLWAGFTALVNQQAVSYGRPTIGFANPALYDNGNVSGSDTLSLNLVGVQDANAGAYTLVATYFGGSVTSALAVLTVSDPPAITRQPVNQTNQPGTMALFTVNALGVPPLYYQWTKNGVALNMAAISPVRTPGPWHYCSTYWEPTRALTTWWSPMPAASLSAAMPH